MILKSSCTFNQLQHAALAALAVHKPCSSPDTHKPAITSSQQKSILEQVPPVIMDAISFLFSTSPTTSTTCTKYNHIFEHLLKYATVEVHANQGSQGSQGSQGNQQGSRALLCIPNQLKLSKSDPQLPCCYATLNTFIRLLCALGILRKQTAGQEGRVVQYELPLNNDFTFQDDALLALDHLMNPQQTKNYKVRRLAEQVKNRFPLLYVSRSAMLATPSGVKEQKDAALVTALDEMHHLIFPLTRDMHVLQKGQLVSQMQSILRQLYLNCKTSPEENLTTENSLTLSSSPSSQKESFTHTDEMQCCPASYSTGDTNGDLSSACASTPQFIPTIGTHSTHEVDSSCERGRHQAQVPMSNSGTNASCTSHTIQYTCLNTCLNTCRTTHPDSNLQKSEEYVQRQQKMGDSRDENLLVENSPVDSEYYSDNDEKSSCMYFPEEKYTDIDTPRIQTNESSQQQIVYTPLDIATAQQLATFIEGHSGNFRSYIALSRRYHPQVLRAAVLNMLTHAFFPDLEGELPGEIDGELTGKVGRPRKPGAWVTSCCQAYARTGIPTVMHLLLQYYTDSYQSVQQQLEECSHEMSPLQFWMYWQEILSSTQSTQTHFPCTDTQEQQAANALDDENEYMLDADNHGNMTRSEAHQLATHINHAGRLYSMQATPRRQQNSWEVEVEIPFEDQRYLYAFRSLSEWETYFHDLCTLQHTCNGERVYTESNFGGNT